MAEHQAIQRATIEGGDGHGALYITCSGCDYETGRTRSRKQAWADFRAHVRSGMTMMPVPPPGPAIPMAMF